MKNNKTTILDVDLEKDFSEVQKKIDEATAALKEANALAKAHGTKLVSLNYSSSFSERSYDDALKLDALMDELYTAGWNTSSMSC